MYKLSWCSTVLLAMFLGGMSDVAMADHGHGGGHVGVGIVIDPFLFGPWYPRPYYAPPYYAPPYYSSPYYYPPAVMSAPAAPPVYVQREDVAPPAPQASASWYYCANPQGYYPYVNQCPAGWQAVAPQPPGAPAEGR